MHDAEDGTKPVYKTTDPLYLVDRDLNSRQRRELREIDSGKIERDWQIAYRGVLPGDFHFVLNAWMQSYRTSVRGVKNNDYYRGQQNLISEIAKRRTLIVACDANMPDYIYGFICGVQFENHKILIDYVYVKKMYRDRGVGRGLVNSLGYKEEIGAVVTHVTPCVKDIIVAQSLDYNPYYNCLGYSDV